MPQKTKPVRNRARIEYTIRCEEECEPVRGNVMQTDEPELDKAEEDAIIVRLEKGDRWAWCIVTVTAHLDGHIGSDTLAGCSYKNEADFRSPGGYFEDMKRAARRRLRENLEALVKDGDHAKAILAKWGGGK